MSARRAGLLPILGIGAAAAVLGIALMARWPLWLDELASLGFARLAWADLLGPIARLETNPPTYYLLLKLWVAAFGESDLSLRVPSALCVAGATILLGLFARRAFGPTAGIAAALFTASSGWIFATGHQARTYGLAILLIAIGMVLAARLADALARRNGWAAIEGAALALVATALMSLHYVLAIFAMALFVQAGTSLLVARALTLRATATLIGAGLGAMLLALPVIAMAIHFAAAPRSEVSWIGQLGVVTTLRMMASVLLTPAFDAWMQPLFLRVAGVMSGAITVGLLLAGCWRWRRDPAFWGCAAFLGFAGLAFGAVNMRLPIALPRTILFLLPPLIVLVAAGVAALPQRGLRAGAIAILVALHGLSIAQVSRRAIEHEDWRGLAQELAQRLEPGETVLTLGPYEAMGLERYLPPAHPARPRRSVVPPAGAEYAALAVRLMTGATPVPLGELRAELCAEAPPAVWVPLRLSSLPGPMAAAAFGRDAADPSVQTLRVSTLR